jgi:D-glycero-alpha-D-manno-heptose 1-phosphate guanylyltransferase
MSIDATTDSGPSLQLRELQAVILCGGLGTRLSRAVPGLPKSLAPIAGRPFLDYLLNHLATAGIRDLVFCTGYRSESIEAEYATGARLGLSIEYSVESSPLGTAGALKQAAPLIRSNPFFLLNGDSFLDLDFHRLLNQHHATAATATMTLAQIASPLRYGAITLHANGAVHTFAEKGTAIAKPSPAGTLINAGIYALNRDVLDRIPAAPPAVSFEYDTLPSLIGRGLFGFVSNGFFIDIGIPDDYQRAQIEIPKRTATRAYSHSR